MKHFNWEERVLILMICAAALSFSAWFYFYAFNGTERTVIYVSEGWPDTTVQMVRLLPNGISIGGLDYIQDKSKTDDPYLLDPITEDSYLYGWDSMQTRRELIAYDEQIYIIW